MMAQVLDLQGNKIGEVELPFQFDAVLRPDLARRAFHAQASLLFQPKGIFPLAGQQTSAAYFGRRHESRQSINVGRSRLPREKLAGMRLGRVRIVPHSVKGRRAHPPKPQTELVEKINAKEKRKAIRGAIAATAVPAAVKKRGHVFEAKLPLIVDSSFESLKKTSEVRKTLEKLGLSKDLERAEAGRKHRSGKRKGGYRTPKSILVIYAKDSGIAKAARGIAGVDAVAVTSLDAFSLAPGGVAGRLALWTKDAVEELADKKLYS